MGALQLSEFYPTLMPLRLGSRQPGEDGSSSRARGGLPVGRPPGLVPGL